MKTEMNAQSNNFVIVLKGSYLGSNLFPDKASHENNYLPKILFSNDMSFLSYVKSFGWSLRTTLFYAENECVHVYNFFDATKLTISLVILLFSKNLKHFSY